MPQNAKMYGMQEPRFYRMFQFSKYGEASRIPAPVNQMMAQFAEDFRDGVDVNLGVGYVNERTIPREYMAEALGAVIARPKIHRQAFNYGGPKGAPNLLRALTNYLVTHRTGGLDAALLSRLDLLIGPSGATSILEGLAQVMAPGIVLTADPMYYIYCNYLERMGFRVVTVPEDRAGLDPVRLRAKIDALGSELKALSFIYVVTVNNPSCTVLTNVRRRELVHVAASLSARLQRTVPIVFDTAYEWLIHDSAVPAPESPLLHDGHGVAIEVGTLSKVLAPALRVGFLLGPPGALMDALVQHTSDVGFSAPLITQEMAAYLIEHHMAAQATAVNAGYREKALAVRAAIEEHLGPYLEDCRGGQAGFYFYLTLRDVETAPGSPFFCFLTRTTGDPAVDGPAGAPNPRVIYIPGSYCVHPAGDSVEIGRRQLRVSYGFEEVAEIVSALALMREAAAWATDISGEVK